MKKLLIAVALIALTAGIAQAQPMPSSDPATPSAPMALDETPSPNGAAQIEQRVQDQQQKIDAAAQSGQIGAEQKAHDEKHLHHIKHKLHKAQRRHGGTISKGEQGKLNEKLNKNAHHLHHQIKKSAETNGASAH